MKSLQKILLLSLPEWVVPESTHYWRWRTVQLKVKERQVIRMVSLYSPSWHTTLFQHSYNVIWTLWTLYERWNHVVCRLGWLPFLVSLPFRQNTDAPISRIFQRWKYLVFLLRKMRVSHKNTTLTRKCILPELEYNFQESLASKFSPSLDRYPSCYISPSVIKFPILPLLGIFGRWGFELCKKCF